MAGLTPTIMHAHAGEERGKPRAPEMERFGRGLAGRGGSALGLALLLLLLLSTASDGFRMPSLNTKGMRTAKTASPHECVRKWMQRCGRGILDRGVVCARGLEFRIHIVAAWVKSLRELTIYFPLHSTPPLCSVKEAPVGTALFAEGEGGSSTGPAKAAPRLNVTGVRTRRSFFFGCGVQDGLMHGWSDMCVQRPHS